MDDLFTYRAERVQQGLDLAEKKAGEPWIEYAVGFLHDILLRKRIVDSDTLWDEDIIAPESHPAMGGVWRRARAKGWIRELTHDGYLCCKISTNKRCNGRLIRVYESTIFEELNG